MSPTRDLEDVTAPQGTSALEQALALPSGTMQRVHDADDWSFIVLCTAVAEAVVTQLITEHYGVSGGGDRVLRLGTLELGDRSRGKLALISAMGLLDAHRRDFVIALAQLRAVAVLDIRHLRWELSAHIATLPDARQADLTLTPPVGSREGPSDSAAAKRAIWLNLQHLLLVLLPDSERPPTADAPELRPA